MQHAVITELETSLAFDAEIDNPPSVKENFTTVFIDGNEVSLSNPDAMIDLFHRTLHQKLKVLYKTGQAQERRSELCLITVQQCTCLKVVT